MAVSCCLDFILLAACAHPCSTAQMMLKAAMPLKTLRRLTWLSVLRCFVSWLATAERLDPVKDGIPVKLVVPNKNAPQLLL